MTEPSPFGCFRASPEVICLAVMMYVRFPLSLRNVKDFLHERGIDVSYETVRFWRHRFGHCLHPRCATGASQMYD
jgi:putative transposase